MQHIPSVSSGLRHKRIYAHTGLRRKTRTTRDRNLNGLFPKTFVLNGYGMVQNEFMHTLVFDLTHGLMVTPFQATTKL